MVAAIATDAWRVRPRVCAPAEYRASIRPNRKAPVSASCCAATTFENSMTPRAATSGAIGQRRRQASDPQNTAATGTATPRSSPNSVSTAISKAKSVASAAAMSTFRYRAAHARNATVAAVWSERMAGQ